MKEAYSPLGDFTLDLPLNKIVFMVENMASYFSYLQNTYQDSR